MRKKGLALNGRNPVLLTGYGGFGISLEPAFHRVLPVWLEAGGVFAEANLRGGGEFGETWHEQGMLHNKQNVFDDFIACAQWLVAHKYTSPPKLAIEGGSNGGLLMGAALTQSPKTFRAVVAHVGYFDMLRFEVAPNGVFNTTEYGTVKNEADFKALAAYSPYQHVKAGTQYPAVLFLTGKNDPRVDPFHSRKMVAQLEASGTRQPVLLRVGHRSWRRHAARRAHCPSGGYPRVPLRAIGSPAIRRPTAPLNGAAPLQFPRPRPRLLHRNGSSRLFAGVGQRVWTIQRQNQISS